MTRFSYRTGEDVLAGDRITYHGESANVQFVVSAATGDPSLDWYLDEYPGGGVMIEAEGFGDVFLRAADIGDDVEFVSRTTGERDRR